MSIKFRILGTAGNDNALLVQVDSGQSIDRLLFDCGDGCLTELTFAEIQAIDHLFFSHLHMDHVGGFDGFFRCTFNRDTKPNRIWGPPETTNILQHRFRGFLWNLHEEMSSTWLVSDIHPEEIRTSGFELREAFAVAHPQEARPYKQTIYESDGFVIEAITMEHRTPTIAYVVREKPRKNIDTARLASIGLKPGPWMKQLKDPANALDTIVIDGHSYPFEELRRALITETPGDSIAYLTDFLLDENALNRLSEVLNGCQTIVCEGQYRHSDQDLAKKNFHMTTALSATLAKRANVKELILFHLSDRYEPSVWAEMLEEAKQVFPNTRYPAQWQIAIKP